MDQLTPSLPIEDVKAPEDATDVLIKEQKDRINVLEETEVELTARVNELLGVVAELKKEVQSKDDLIIHLQAQVRGPTRTIAEAMNVDLRGSTSDVFHDLQDTIDQQAKQIKQQETQIKQQHTQIEDLKARVMRPAGFQLANLD